MQNKLARLKKRLVEFRRKLPKKTPLILAIVFVLIAVSGTAAVLVSQGLIKRPQLTAPSETPLTKLPTKIKVLQAKVALESGGQKLVLQVGKEWEVKQGDKITTDLNGIAQLQYQSGTVVRIGQNSEITFTGPDNLMQSVGKIYVRFKKLVGIQEKFEAESALSIAAIRGTAFASFLKLNADQKIVVSEDIVEVTPKDKNGNALADQKKVVNAGEQGVISFLNRVLTTGPQVLTSEELQWLEFNQKLDEDPGNIALISQFPSLVIRTPTPTPSATPSASPVPTAPALSAITSMPGGGYTKSNVATAVGTFPLACYGANKFSVRMLTDSASDADCTDNCPVLPLDQYATRNGGVAAINGMYFCPADYASCAGKINTFDTLFFNSRTRFYMNSANNQYSTIPFVGMNADHNMSFVDQSLSWGRDTSIIGGTAGNPMLTRGGTYVVNEGALDDKQRSVKSNRGAIIMEGDMIYLCITQGATVPDSGHVYETLGADNAINIDGGGSSALWVGGSYKYGPGRQIPTAIILAP